MAAKNVNDPKVIAERKAAEAKRRSERNSSEGWKQKGATWQKNARERREGKRSGRSYTVVTPEKEKIIVGGGEYTPGGKGRNASTGDFNTTRKQTIPRVKAKKNNVLASSKTTPQSSIDAITQHIASLNKGQTLDDVVRTNSIKRLSGEMRNNTTPKDDLTTRMQSYINAGKLTKEQKKEAKAVLKEAKAKREQEYKQGNFDSISGLGTDSYKRFQAEKELEAKTNGAGVRGALLPVLKAANAITKGIENVTNTQNTKAAKTLNEQLEAALRQDELSAEQSPLAHGLGNFAGNFAMYSTTNPIFDAAAGGLGVTSTLGKVVANQLGQNAQDIVLDTLPEYQRLKDKGLSDAEIRKRIGENIGWNALGNAGAQVISDVAWPAVKQAIPSLKNWVSNIKTNKTQTIPDLPTAIKYTGTPTSNIDLGESAVANAAKQTQNAAAKIEQLGDVARKAEPVKTTPKFIDNGYDIRDADNVSSHDLINGIRNDILRYSESDLQPTTRKNLNYLNESLDRLEEAYKTGNGFENAYDDYRKAINRVKDNMIKKEGDDYFERIYKETLNADHPENLHRRYHEGLNKAPVPTDAEGFVDPNAIDEEMPFNDSAAIPANVAERMPDRSFTKTIKYEPEDIGPSVKPSEPEPIPVVTNPIPEEDIPRLTTEPQKPTTDMRERGYHASSKERGAIPDEIKQALQEQDSLDRNMYAQKHNWETENEAIDLWSQVNTYDEGETILKDLMNERNPAALPFARRLVSAYSKAGMTENAVKVMDDVSESLTKAGQYTQAAVLGLVKDDPITALRHVEKELDNMNQAGRKKYGKNWTDFKLTDEEKNLFGSLMPGDEEGLRNAYNTIGSRIAREYPVSMMEKIKEETHIDMLLNPRTMTRNVVANVPTLGMRSAANRVESGLQQLAHKIDPNFEITQSAFGGGKAERKLAQEVYAKPEVQDLFKAFDQKYNEQNVSQFIKDKQVFKGTKADKFIDNLLGGKITKANAAMGAIDNPSLLEAKRRACYGLLELGDSPFVKENFVARLASEAKAKGWTSADQVTDDAIQRALNESLEHTYKDPNRLSKLLLDFKKNTGIVGEGAVPFAQTLGSIGMRSIDYSPVGIVKSLTDITKGVRAGNANTISEGIRKLSEGLTGTGMILGGIALYKSGLITGDYSDDPNIKEAQKRAGYKPYAIHIGDKYYTFDWMQPSSIPGILGISIAQALEGGENAAKGIAKGALAATDAWFDQSAFQSLAELLGGGNGSSYGENSIAQNFADMILEMPQRLVPTALGATARTIDQSYRDTYDQTSYLNNYANAIKAKIPFLSETLPQSYDAWGQPRMRANSTGEAAFQQYINPGEYSQESMNDLDTRISAIYDEYPDKKLYPDKIPYSISSGDFNKKLTNEEHSELSRVQGGYNAEFADAMLNNDGFMGLSNEDKAEFANTIYNVARDVAYEELYDKPPTQTNQKLVDAYKDGGSENVIKTMIQDKEISDAGLKSTEKLTDYLDSGGNLDDYKAFKEKVTHTTDSGNSSIYKDDYMTELSKLPKDEQDRMMNAIHVNLTKEEQAAYDEGGADAVIKVWKDNEKKAEEKAREKEAKEKEKARKHKEEARKAGVSEEKLDNLQEQLASLGANDSEKTVYYYNHAKQTIPSLTPKGYVSKLHEIGGDDYKIQQKEMLAYANKNNLSEDKMKQYWNAYGEWAKIPVLVNGTWTAKKAN